MCLKEILGTLPTREVNKIERLFLFPSPDEMPKMELIDQFLAQISRHEEETRRAGDACRDMDHRAEYSRFIFRSCPRQKQKPHGRTRHNGTLRATNLVSLFPPAKLLRRSSLTRQSAARGRCHIGGRLRALSIHFSLDSAFGCVSRSRPVFF